MEDDEGGVLGGDPNEQFHRTEAISAVVDEGFLGEEDDDFEDLYNDVNVGGNFLQSMNKNEVHGANNEVGVADNVSMHMTFSKTPPLPLNVAPDTANAGIGEVEKNLGRGQGDSSAQLHSSGVVEGYQQNMGFGGQRIGGGTGGSVKAPGDSGLIPEPGQQHINKRDGVIDEHIAGKTVSSQGVFLNPHVPPPAPSGVSATRPAGIVGNLGNEGLAKHYVSGAGVNGSNGYGNVGAGGGAPVIEIGGARGTMLFVGDLNWWTTDAELETELCKYGIVKEVRFYDEKASGKSKGYCQVEFYDAAAASACKEGMHGHVFNGRPCVVAHASPFTIKRMGEAQLNRNQPTPTPQVTAPPGRRAAADVPGRPVGSNIVSGGNFQGPGDNNRGGYGRGNWVRGNTQGMGGRGPVAPMRNRPGGMVGRGMIGNGGMGFTQGMGGPPPFLPPHQSMMGPGFDPSFGGPMARMGGYGGFPGGLNPPFNGVMPPFPPGGTVGLPGVAPHVNPAFFGRGMPMNGMGMMPSGAVDGPNAGMWGDHNMGSWANEEHGGRVGESSYGEEAISDHPYGEGSHDRSPWPNPVKEKDRGSERDWPGSPDRKYRDDRESGYDRDMVNDNEWSERGHHDERDVGRDRDRDRERGRERSRDRERTRVSERKREHDRDRQQEDKDQSTDNHRHRERGQDYDDEWDRGRSSSRARSKSRLSSHEEEHRVRSRDADYGKRRRSDN